MRYALAAVMVMWGGSAEAKKPAQEFKYDMWEAWNSFKVGSSVVLETEASGMKMKTTTTIVKKEEKSIWVEDVMEMSGNKMPANKREIKKPEGGTGGGTSGDCPMCKKPVKDHKKPDVKESKEKVKIGDKEIECAKMETTTYDCQGKESGHSTSWYTKEIPGWMAKMQGKYGTVESKQNCVSFDAKK